MAKQVIADEMKIYIPATTVKLQSGPVPDIGMLECSVNYPERHVELVSVIPEKKEGRWKPDLTATLKNGVCLYIEIQVTHAVHPEKALSLDNLIEIDLSKIDREMVYNAKAFSNYVTMRAIRRWHQCSLYDDLKKVKEAQVSLDSRASALINSHEAEEKRRCNEKVAKDREANKRLFSQRAKAKEDFKSSLNVREQLKDALIAIEQRKLSFRPEPAGGQDSIPVEGEWIFSVPRSTWQDFILSQCIQSMPIDVAFTAANLLPRLVARFPWDRDLARVLPELQKLSASDAKKIPRPESVIDGYLSMLAAHAVIAPDNGSFKRYWGDQWSQEGFMWKPRSIK
jgi:hypothetical protein